MTRLASALAGRARAHRGDLFGVGALVLLALLFLAPAVKDGFSFGGFDFDTTLTGFGSGVYRVVHSTTNGDAVSQMVAWNDLSWRLVHSGHFPMWNQYSALGMPQFLNFESSVLSLPDLVSYLAPLRDAFFVVVLMKLLIAGTGTYVLARVLRCAPLAAAFGGASFMLAGAFSSWLTWPLSDVLAWSGWIAAFAVLCLRSYGRLRHVVGLGISVAFSVYGGFPEASVLLAIALAATVVVVLLLDRLGHRSVGVPGIARAAAGALLGGLLSAPLWLPGLQVISVSHRETEGDYVGLPTKALSLFVTQGYFGLPTGPHPTFYLVQWKYYESVAYVGAVALVLVVVAVGTSIRRPIVAGLLVALLLSLAFAYEPVAFHPLQSLVFHVPGLSRIRFERMRAVSAFLVAVLAALGLQQLLRAPRARSTRWSFALGTALVSAWVAYLDLDTALGPAARRHALSSLVWPTASAIVLVAVALWLLLGATRGVPRRVVPALAAGLALLQVAFLYFAGVGIPSYSKPFFEVTPAIARLQSIVGDQLVGLDGGNVTSVRAFAHVGFYPNVNIGYSVHLFALHDPLTPSAYYTSWPVQSAASNEGGVGLFVPDVDTVEIARRYGIAYLLSPAGVTPPAGTVKIATLGGELLSKVPGATRFSFVGGGQRVVRSSSDGDGSWRVTTEGRSSGRLVLRITAEPGFRASIDGRPVALQHEDGVMLAVEVPPGHHVVRLTYLPRRLELGLAAAVLGVLVAAAAAVLGLVRRRRTTAEVPSAVADSDPALR